MTAEKTMEYLGFLLAAIALALAALTSSGCGTRTVIVPPGKTVKLRQDVPNVKIWAKDASGSLVPGVADLKQGWLVLPPAEPAKGNP